ncbi:ribonuclease HII [Acuticoccus sp. 2012]|uniref:Ribonuclease HII n=2 Tax=Acuticoccus mangrovi TaxID=2796142 RepID=A0A934IQC1_9HYPH|nr:ribonuclease HII [Acuticoccus mangrovi]
MPRHPSPFRQAVCGVDEAGRGPLAGPVVVAAVILPRDHRIDGIADSKVLSPAVRERLFEIIVREAMVSTVVVGAARIDAMNIRMATLWGMRRAIAALPQAPTVALIDGRDLPPGVVTKCRALVDGDARSTAIGAASIVAKVTRDRLMTRLALSCPGYGFERHKGYATAEHRAALAALGASIHHRRSFAPVRAALEAHASAEREAAA